MMVSNGQTMYVEFWSDVDIIKKGFLGTARAITSKDGK